MSKIKESINEIILLHLGTDVLEQLDNTDFQDIVDSLSFVKILVAIEGCFDIEIEDEYINLDSFQSLPDLYEYVIKKLN